jgi:hypothetical protein
MAWLLSVLLVDTRDRIFPLKGYFYYSNYGNYGVLPTLSV